MDYCDGTAVSRSFDIAEPPIVYNLFLFILRQLLKLYRCLQVSQTLLTEGIVLTQHMSAQCQHQKQVLAELLRLY